MAQGMNRPLFVGCYLHSKAVKRKEKMHSMINVITNKTAGNSICPGSRIK